MPTSTDDPGYDFLKTEYTQCIDLVKFYDGRQHDLVKFASGLAAAVPTLVLTFRDITNISASSVWDFTALIALVTGVSLLTIFTALVQNRLYFVFAARQANGIRKKLINGSGLEKNHMYSNYPVPAFQVVSSQTMQYAFVALQAGTFFGIACYGLRYDGSGAAVSDAIKVAVIASVVALVIAAAYLIWRDSQNPGEPLTTQAGQFADVR